MQRKYSCLSLKLIIQFSKRNQFDNIETITMNFTFTANERKTNGLVGQPEPQTTIYLHNGIVQWRSSRLKYRIYLLKLKTNEKTVTLQDTKIQTHGVEKVKDIPTCHDATYSGGELQ